MSETPTDCTYCDGSGTKLEKYKGCDSECGCTDIVPCEECNGTGVSLLAQLTEAVKRAEAAGADALKWKITSDAHCLVMIEDLHPKIDKLGGAIDRLTNERDELKSRCKKLCDLIHTAHREVGNGFDMLASATWDHIVETAKEVKNGNTK